MNDTTVALILFAITFAVSYAVSSTSDKKIEARDTVVVSVFGAILALLGFVSIGSGDDSIPLALLSSAIPIVAGNVIGHSLYSPINWFTKWRYPELLEESEREKELKELVAAKAKRMSELMSVHMTEGDKLLMEAMQAALTKQRQELEEELALRLKQAKTSRNAERTTRATRRQERKRLADAAWADEAHNVFSAASIHLNAAVTETELHKEFWESVRAYMHVFLDGASGKKNELRRLLKWRDDLRKKVAALPEDKAQVDGALFAIDIGGVRDQHVKRLAAIEACIATLVAMLEYLPGAISAINLDVPVGLEYAEEKRDELASHMASLLDNIEMTIGLSPLRANNESIAHADEARRLMETGKYEAAIALREVDEYLGDPHEEDPRVAEYEAARGAVGPRKKRRQPQ